MTEEEAYKEYRKEYKRQWFQRKKKEVAFNKWITNNPQFKDVPNIKDIYLQYGGVEARKIADKHS